MPHCWALLTFALALSLVPSSAATEQNLALDKCPTDPHLSGKSESAFSPNALTDTVLYGATPVKESDFERLQTLGVRAIISVDGVSPKTVHALERSISYLHLPIGYGRIDDGRAMDLAKATKSLPGKIYIHCHYGQHRAPAAAIVACVGIGSIPPHEVDSILSKIYPNTKYKSLVDSARRARVFPTGELANHQIDFAGISHTNATSKLMSELVGPAEDLFKMLGSPTSRSSVHLDRLTHDSLLVFEAFQELNRRVDSTETSEKTARLAPKETDVPKQGARAVAYQTLLSQTVTTAKSLHQHLANRGSTVSSEWISLEITPLVNQLKTQCVNCHQSYR